jgi:imidazole glycerol-phosphate synthase subunit HisH
VIAVVDYGAGNLRSIRRALEAAGAEVVVTSDPEVVASADAVVLPGVGAAGHAMKTLDGLGLTPVLKEAGDSGKPFLGICLGMQLLFRDQDEGATAGLGLMPGRIRRLAADVKVPHIGWNRSRVTADGPLGRAGDECYYYFVHSYVAEPDDPADTAAEAEYGESFPSVVVRNNIWGTQFHPELSSNDGLALVRAFVESAGESRRQGTIGQSSSDTAEVGAA